MTQRKSLSPLTILWLLWLTGALICLALLRYQQQRQDTSLPLPIELKRIDIIRADTTLSFQASPDWQHNGQHAAKLGQWLEQLRHSCPQSYPETEIRLPPDSAPITLRINGEDDWTFTAHNPFNRSHYLHHQGRVYLCQEQLKPRLTLPPSYWLNPN